MIFTVPAPEAFTVAPDPEFCMTSGKRQSVEAVQEVPPTVAVVVSLMIETYESGSAL